MKYSNRNIAIIMILCLLLGTAGVFLLKQNHKLNLENKRLAQVIANSPQRQFEPVLDTIFETIIREKDTIIRSYQIIPRRQHGSVAESSIPVSYLDSVARALKLGEKAITEQTRINTELSKKLTKKDLKIQQIENENTKLKTEVWTWKNDRAEVVARISDSIAEVRYNAAITVTDYSKKPSWFSAREYFTAVSTDDEDLTINGVQRYEQKMNFKCPKIQFGLQGGIGLVSPVFDNENNIYPGYYVGTGVQLNF